MNLCFIYLKKRSLWTFPNCYIYIFFLTINPFCVTTCIFSLFLLGNVTDTQPNGIMRSVIHLRKEFKITLKGGLNYCSTLRSLKAASVGAGEKLRKIVLLWFCPQLVAIGRKSILHNAPCCCSISFFIFLFFFFQSDLFLFLSLPLSLLYSLIHKATHTHTHTHTHTYTHTHAHTHTYIYIYIEREREIFSYL